MNTFDDNVYTRHWERLSTEIAEPSAVLAISAHWTTNGSLVTGNDMPPTIHDFYGFPERLATFDYPAPGSPELAARIVDAIGSQRCAIDHSWGLDHGTWSVLARMYPSAQVPVLQLSLDLSLPAKEHMAVGAALQPLRNEGVLIIGTGNVVHNLGAMNRSLEHEAYDWAGRFDRQVQQLMTSAPGELPAVMRGEDWQRSAPTPEHFLPLLYISGLAASGNQGAQVTIEGAMFGSLTMTSYLVN